MKNSCKIMLFETNDVCIYDGFLVCKNSTRYLCTFIDIFLMSKYPPHFIVNVLT